MTCDVTLNPTASILVMTTEILRRMLYEGDILTNELSCVIYDDIHYMKNVEHGVDYSSPSSNSFCFSATIQNARDFSEWIFNNSSSTMSCHIHGRTSSEE